MKHLYFLFSVCFILGGCHFIEGERIEQLGGPQGRIMLTSDRPFADSSGPAGEMYDRLHYYFMDVPGSGAAFTVTASFPAEENIPLNDYYSIAWSDSSIPESQVTVEREKINSFQSSYSISVKPNTIGIPYEIYIKLMDETRTDNSGQHYESNATLVIRQGV